MFHIHVQHLASLRQVTLARCPTPHTWLLFVRPLPLNQSGKVRPTTDLSPSRHSYQGQWGMHVSQPRQGNTPWATDEFKIGYACNI